METDYKKTARFSTDKYRLLRQQTLDLLPIDQVELYGKLDTSIATIRKIIFELMENGLVIRSPSRHKTYFLELNPIYEKGVKIQESRHIILEEETDVDPDDKMSCSNIRKSITELKKDPESLFNDVEFVKKIKEIDKRKRVTEEYGKCWYENTHKIISMTDSNDKN